MTGIEIAAIITAAATLTAGIIKGLVEWRKNAKEKAAPPTIDEFSRIIESYDRLVDNLEAEQKRLRETLEENERTIVELRRRIAVMRQLLEEAKINYEERL